MLRVLREIGQVDVRQIHKELLHVLASDVDEVAPHAIADSARSAMKHEPDSLRFIQTDLDEMVTRSECAEMVRMIAAIQLRVLREYGVVTSFQLAQPDASIALRNIIPCAPIANSAVIRPAVRNRSLNRCANSLQIIREITGIQTGLNRHHAATDVHANSGRDDCAFGWDHTSNGCADSPMNVGHRSDPFEDERKLRGIQELLARGVFKGNAFRPGLHRHTGFGCDYVVCGL